MQHLPTFDTKRLFLRPFERSDAKAVYTFDSHPKVNEYTGQAPIQSIEEAKEILENNILKDYKSHGYGRYAVVYKPTNELIGFTGLKYLPELKETDIGFRFSPTYWGKGIATESALPFIEYAQNTLELSHVIGIADPQNVGSCRVLEKLGMHHYKTGEYDGDGGAHRWYKRQF